MTEPVPDPRPPEARPPHWNYRAACDWQSRFVWEDRVAMSELGIGPDNVSQNTDGRVTAVHLRGRNLPDECLTHLAAFPFLSGVMLNDTPITDACIEHLLAIPHLRTLWIVGTQITPAGVERIEQAKPEALVFSKPGEGAVPGQGGGWVKIRLSY